MDKQTIRSLCNLQVGYKFRSALGSSISPHIGIYCRITNGHRRGAKFRVTTLSSAPFAAFQHADCPLITLLIRQRNLPIKAFRSIPKKHGTRRRRPADAI